VEVSKENLKRLEGNLKLNRLQTKLRMCISPSDSVNKEAYLNWRIVIDKCSTFKLIFDLKLVNCNSDNVHLFPISSCAAYLFC